MFSIKQSKPEVIMANTVIFKWNPAISSYNMIRFLNDIVEENPESDWSVWDYERVRAGDTFFMLKVGEGQNGIVMHGTITSDPATAPDWTRQDRMIYYCDYKADVMINPDTFPLLSSAMLRDNIPGFDWFGGHSGLILDKKQADVLDALWRVYLDENEDAFQERLEMIEKRDYYNDQLYVAEPEPEPGPETCYID